MQASVLEFRQKMVTGDFSVNISAQVVSGNLSSSQGWYLKNKHQPTTQAIIGSVKKQATAIKR